MDAAFWQAAQVVQIDADDGDGELVSGWAVITYDAGSMTTTIWSPVYSTQAEAAQWRSLRRAMDQAGEGVADLIDYLGQQIAELTGAVDTLAQGMYWRARDAGQYENASEYRAVRDQVREIRAATYVLRKPVARQLEQTDGAESTTAGESSSNAQ